MRTLISTNIKKVLLIPILLLGGCIAEDLSQCPVGLSLIFTYTHNTFYRDLFTDEVKTLDLFMYDENGDFVARKHISSADMGQANSYPISFMPVGDYTVVVWGNMEASRFNKTYIPKLTDMKVSVETNQKRLVGPGTYSLFHGLATIRATDRGVKTIPLIKDTNDVHIVIEDDMMPFDPYIVQLDGSNGDYNYDNSLAGNAGLQHISTCTIDDLNQTQHTDFTVMRFFKEGNMQISFKNASGELVYEESLTQRILQNLPVYTQADLDRLDKYTFYYRISNTNGTNSFALIRINDWQVVDNPSGV